MAPLPLSIFTNGGLQLRIWFNDDAHGFQKLSPDQQVASSPFSMMSGNIADGTITTAKLAAGTAAALTSTLTSQIGSLNLKLIALTAQVNGLTNGGGGSVSNISGATATSLDPQDATLLGLGYQLITSIPGPGWATSGADSPPSAPTGQASVWTGQQLLVWGGNLGGGVDSGSGAAYLPSLDIWQPILAGSAPSARDQHTAVWSGQAMMVWGGASGGNYVNTGALYDPTNEAWTPLTTNNAPSGRVGHAAAWTGGRMVIWGGRNTTGILSDGGWYDRWRVNGRH